MAHQPVAHDTHSAAPDLTQSSLPPKPEPTYTRPIFNIVTTPENYRDERYILPIASLVGIPSRVVNYLEKNGIETVYDLVSAPRTQLTSIRGLAEKSIGILIETLGKFGEVAHLMKTLPEAGIPSEASKILKECGIETVWQLLHLSPRNLREIFAPEALRQNNLEGAVLQALADLGFKKR